MTIDPREGDTGDFGFRGLAPGVYTLTELPPIAAHVMPSAPDVDGNGTVDTTVTLIVGSGQELVWQDGAAGDLQPGQEEVNVADDGRTSCCLATSSRVRSMASSSRIGTGTASMTKLRMHLSPLECSR